MADRCFGACLDTARRAAYHVSHLCDVDPQVKEWLRIGGKIPASLLEKAQAAVPLTNLSSTAQAGFIEEAAAKLMVDVVTIATIGVLSLETTPRIVPTEMHYHNIVYYAANLLAAATVPWTVAENEVSGTDEVGDLAVYQARSSLQESIMKAWTCAGPALLAGTDKNTPA